MTTDWLRHAMTAEEVQSRSRFLIIFDLPEYESNDVEAKKKEDYAAVCDICKYLSIPKPFGISSARRLNTFAVAGVRPPLLFELNSAEDVQLLLSRKQWLALVPVAKDLQIISVSDILQIDATHIWVTPRLRIPRD